MDRNPVEECTKVDDVNAAVPSHNGADGRVLHCSVARRKVGEKCQVIF
jgi:hypothetical protein